MANSASVGLTLLLVVIGLNQIVLGQDVLTTAFDSCNAAQAVGSFVCDPDNLLSTDTARHLNSTLIDIAANTRCRCANRSNCDHPTNGGPANFNVGLIAVNDLPADYANVTERLLKESRLNAGDCKNGMLIAYSKNAGKVYTVVGQATFGLLSTKELQNIHKETEKDLSLSKNDTAMQVLLNRYYEELSYRDKQDRVYQGLIGGIVAAAVAFLAFALILALCCALLCPEDPPKKMVPIPQQSQFDNPSLVSDKPMATPAITAYPANNRASYTEPSEPIYIVTEPSEVGGTVRGGGGGPRPVSLLVGEYPPAMMMMPQGPIYAGGELPPEAFMDPGRSVEYQKKQAYLY